MFAITFAESVGSQRLTAIALIVWLLPGLAAGQAHRAVRLATFNVSLNRQQAGQLRSELESGSSAQAGKIAEIIQRVRPDVILLNEVDYDGGKSVATFHQRYLQHSQNGQPAIEYPFRFAGPVNTGVDSGLDLDGNGTPGQNGDAFGFGAHPGQYGMAVLSRFPIDSENARSFQHFLWKDMPAARWPRDLTTGENFYSEAAQAVFRLSSKTHLDLPIRIGDQTLHFLCAHPTPPVFDGSEDRNGCRNHDEIRLLADLVAGGQGASYIYDDRGRRGGLAETARFVIAGDMNADPYDGQTLDNPIRLLLDHPRVQGAPAPDSRGAVEASRLQGRVNLQQRGDPAADTADFDDASAGNLRVDYVLPSVDLKVISRGVFWPGEGEPGSELLDASDHRMVWIDIEF